jgi:hypothetical protein
VDPEFGENEAMRYLDLLTDRATWQSHLEEFHEELDAIISMHRYLVQVSERQFSTEYDRLMSRPGDGSYDGGDAMADAEEAVGVAPWDVASHAGLMAITQAVSLAEVVLARMAAAHVEHPEHWIFPRGQLWVRKWEHLFYRTVPVTGFSTNSNGFSTLRSLRDLYAHGYGIPSTNERRQKLARSLYAQFDTGPITAKETALGYTGDAYFFGQETQYSPRTQTLETTGFGAKRADVSLLATYRVLERIRDHIQEAHAALSNGLHPKLDAGNNDFVKHVAHWWSQTGP